MAGKKRLIWVLEDDEGSRFVYEEILGLRYRLRQFGRLDEFLKALETVEEVDRPELIVADLRLPDDSFVTALNKDGNRALLARQPFLVVSSVDDIDILRLCFKEGALDYVTKPFGKNELIVKIERALSQGTKDELVDGCKIDPIAMTVTDVAGNSVSLTSKEFQILSLLRSEAKQTATREAIISRVWNRVMANTKTVDIHIFNLRRKLSAVGLGIDFRPPNNYVLAAKRPAQATG